MDNISGNLKNKIPRFESKNIRIVSCVFISSTVHYLVYCSGLCEHFDDQFISYLSDGL